MPPDETALSWRNRFSTAEAELRSCFRSWGARCKARDIFRSLSAYPPATQVMPIARARATGLASPVYVRPAGEFVIWRAATRRRRPRVRYPSEPGRDPRQNTQVLSACRRSIRSAADCREAPFRASSTSIRTTICWISSRSKRRPLPSPWQPGRRQPGLWPRDCLPDPGGHAIVLHAKYRPDRRTLRASSLVASAVSVVVDARRRGCVEQPESAQRAAILRAAKDSVVESYNAAESVECKKLKDMIDINDGTRHPTALSKNTPILRSRSSNRSRILSAISRAVISTFAMLAARIAPARGRSCEKMAQVAPGAGARRINGTNP